MQRDPRNKHTYSHREIPEKHKTGNHDIYMQKTNKKKKNKNNAKQSIMRQGMS